MGLDKSKLWTVGLSVATLALIYSVVRLNNAPLPIRLAVLAKPAPIVAKIAKVDTPVLTKTVKTLPPVVKRKLHLPPPVQADVDQHVIDAVVVPADGHSHTLTPVLNLKTGVTKTYVRVNPDPWFAMDFSGDAAVYLGLYNGTPALRLQARQSVFKIKSIHFGGMGSVTQPIAGMPIPPAGFIGLGFWGPW